MVGFLEWKSIFATRYFFSSIGKKCLAKISVEFWVISLCLVVAILLFVRTRGSSRALYCGVD